MWAYGKVHIFDINSQMKKNADGHSTPVSDVREDLATRI